MKNKSNHHLTRPTIEPNRVYSRAEVAEILNVSLSTVKRAIASGQIRASQPPGMRRVFITGQAILDMLEASEMHPHGNTKKSNQEDQD
ncbi:MAG: DNA-binding protein [Phototrophicales bacterium]|nr:MAG: DNA-binding protein [Phototrophicales bacterium]